MRRTLSVLGVFLFALSAMAGERLPDGVLVHVSTSSLAAVAANLDVLAVACVKDTPTAQQYNPGTLPVLIGMFSPLPNGAWDQKGEIHVLAVIAEPMNPQPAFIIRTPGLAAFKKAMSDGGSKVQGDGKKMSAQLPMLGGTWYFADLGGNRVAGAMSEPARDFLVKIVASGWTPKHSGNADLAMNLDLKNLLAEYKPAYDAGMVQFRQQFENLDDKMNDTPESAKPLFAALSTVFLNMVDKLDEEVPTMNNLCLDLFFGDERLKLAFSLSGDEGSFLDALRVAYAGKGQPKYAFANSLPEETFLALGVSDMSVIPEGMVDFYVDSLREIANVVIPDRADEFANLPREYFNLGIKECMVGSYLAHEQPITVFAFECEKSKEFQALLPRAVELGREYANNVLEMGGQAESLSVDMEYEVDAGKVGNVPYRKISFSFNRAGSGDMIRYDTLFAIGRKTVTGVYGQVDEDDLAFAIANFQKSPGDFINSDSVKIPLDDIENRQIEYLGVRPLMALASFFIGQAALAGIDIEKLAAAAGEMSVSPECLAMGVGATDKLVTSEWVIPAEVVNNIILNAKAIEAMSAVINPEKSNNGEVYFDDPQEHEEADEDEYFDDPVQNSQ